jgi:xanthine dehydrogenase accessory factor
MAGVEQTLLDALEKVLAQNGLAVLVTIVAAETGVGAKLLLQDGKMVAGALGDSDLEEALALHAETFLQSRREAQTFGVEEFAPELGAWRGARVLCERIEPEPRLVICGAGHVGAALARIALLVGYQTTLIDDRAVFVTRERFPDERLKLVAATTWAGAAAAEIGNGRGVSVAVVTRGHNEDEECMRAVLAARPDYVGMIGSRRRTNIVLARLRQEGFGAEQLNAVRAPVGLDIGSVSPAEVALSIMAEIIAERRGGTGHPLSAWRRG